MDTKKLRQKILDLAIHGKLVPQDPNDEPASVLLERIRAEKERLIAEGKIKRSKKSATSDTPHYENVPFEIPEGWSWCTLDDLAFYKKGPFGSSLTKSMFVPDSPSAYKVYEQKNAIQKDHTLGSYFIDEEKYKELSGFKVEPNDIIVSCAGTIGETYVMPNDIREGIINQALMLIRLHLQDVQDFYLLYFDFILKAEAAKESKGTAIKNIPPFDVLKSFLIPIPPLAEQGRILEEVNKLMSFVDSIDVSSKDISSLINSAKSKILDLAFHGKLVSQDASDEPANELLKRINPKAPASSDNPHYADIPESWVECKLGDVCSFESGYAYSSELYKPMGIPLIRISNIVDGYVNIENCVYIKGDELSKNVQVKQGDLLIAMSGATTGKLGIYAYPDDAILNQRVGNIRVKECSVLSTGYRDLFISAIKVEIEKKAYGGAQPNISGKMICDFSFSLPPYNEQLRIVSKVNEFFSQLDMIEKSLQA